MASQNFGFLKAHEPLFLKLALDAERLFTADPAACVMKLRQLGEAFAQEAAAAVGVYAGPEMDQLTILRTLESKRIVEGKTALLFHQLRRAGNRVTHAVFEQHFVASHQVALDQLKIARHLAIWFHRTFGGVESKTFRPGPFVAPEDVTAEARKLEQDAAGLRATQRESLLDFGKGTVHKTIYFPEVQELRVCVPPVREQARIVSKVDALFAHSKKAKESLDRIPALLEKLKRSILAAAFRGDLTKDWRAQNPDVEPASVLLERIREQRAAEEASPAKARGRRPRAARKAEAAQAQPDRQAESVVADTLDLVVAALVERGKLTSEQAREARALGAGPSLGVVQEPGRGGEVRVRGKARGTAYEWVG